MNQIKLVCKHVTYFSSYDEDAFFEWLQKIPSVKRFIGRLDELYIFFESNIIPDKDLRELMGLFYRYHVDMKQLEIFLNESNKNWFDIADVSSHHNVWPASVEI